MYTEGNDEYFMSSLVLISKIDVEAAYCVEGKFEYFKCFFLTKSVPFKQWDKECVGREEYNYVRKMFSLRNKFC